jgi:uncharacterized membrane protein
MSDRRLRLAIGALALAGAAIAAYLSYTRISDVSIICPTSGCATVQRSSYSELGGVPNAYLGVLAYLAIFATAVSVRPLLVRAGAMLALGAVGYAMYLFIVQLAVIDAVCTWCVASDVVALMLAIAAVLRLRRFGAANPV